MLRSLTVSRGILKGLEGSSVVFAVLLQSPKILLVSSSSESLF